MRPSLGNQPLFACRRLRWDVALTQAEPPDMIRTAVTCTFTASLLAALAMPVNAQASRPTPSATRPAASRPASVERLLREGAALYHKREQEGMAAKAIEVYCKVLAIDESCVEAYWKIAKAYYW